MKSREDILTQMRRCNKLFDQIYFRHGKTERNNSEWPREFHYGVDLWLSGVEGLQRTLEWSIGRTIFVEAFYLLTFEYLRKMRLNGWSEKWAYLPFGEPLPFELNKVPLYEQVRSEDCGMMLERAVAVQNRVMAIEKFHPGKWSLMFHGRAKKWLVNVENIIRTLEWLLERRDVDNAFYLLSDSSLNQLEQARSGGVIPYSAGAVRQVNTLVGMEIGEQDTKAEDFSGRQL